MAIANGSFELEGATPGSAQGWTSTYVSSLEVWADFDADLGDTSSQEAFEREFPFVRELVGETIDTEAAIFNVGPGQTPFERFERAWGTLGMTFLGELAQSEAAVFSSNDQERFEEDWGDIAFTLPEGAVAAAFGDSSHEDFEHWAAIIAGDYEQAVFAGSTAESFELNVPEEITADDSDNTLTLDDPPIAALANDQRARFENEGGALPDPLVEGATYFIVEVSSFTFQVSDEEGGEPLDLADSGSGDTYLVRVWWWQLLTTV